MLSPVWAQLKLGPWLRREYDKRLYLDLFRPGEGEVSGVRRLWVSLIGRREPEPDDLEDGRSYREQRGTRPLIVTFRDARDEFHRLNGRDEIILGDLRGITRPRWLRRADRADLPPVGIHVRRGDFEEGRSAEALRKDGLLQTPIRWFVATLKTLRHEVDGPVTAFVVSDGTEEELRELLAIDGVDLIRTGSAIGDLLLLTRARVLLASVSSSFSAWAAFLGQMPTLSHEGPSWQVYGIRNKHGYHVGGFDPRRPSPRILADVKHAVASGSALGC